MTKGDKNRRKILAARVQQAIAAVNSGEYTAQLRGYSEYGFSLYATTGTGSLDYAIQQIQNGFDDVADCYETKMEDRLALMITFCVE